MSGGGINSHGVYTEAVSRLIGAFERLPGIGGKSAQRLAFHVIGMSVEEVRDFAETVVNAKESVKYCGICCNLADSDPCRICTLAENGQRNKNVIMAVEDARDMAAYERTKQYNGVYHILHGAISPLNGVSPEDIKIAELLLRIKNNPQVSEIIVATNPNIEGEATAMYLSKLIKPLGVRVTRIANGVPVGGDLEYIDQVTLLRALEGRRDI